MDIVIAVVAAVVAGIVGLLIGRSGSGGAAEQARAEADAAVERRMRAVAEAVARGSLPGTGKPGSPEADLKRALESGWAPRGVEHQRALREALTRVGKFLDQSVRQPLAGASSTADAAELRERIDRALGALEDLEFFMEEPSREVEGQNVSGLVQQVTREFAQDQAATIRFRTDGPVRADVNRRAFMDALYLVLHNAARFGGNETVEVTVQRQEARAVIEVRDRGKGFTEEAFKRAFDPFYSTADDGLGLGLPHARKSFEAMGGRIELSNAPDGGGKVEISFPAA